MIGKRAVKNAGEKIEQSFSARGGVSMARKLSGPMAPTGSRKAIFLDSRHLPVLVILAIATTAIFMLVVAYDSRRRDDSPWV